jgi:hypothetical protein
MFDTWAEQLRVRAWYSVFRVAAAAANQAPLLEIRNLLLEALEAVDKAEEFNNGA